MSAADGLAWNQEVAGSSPVIPTIKVYEEAGSSVALSMQLGRFDSAIHRIILT
jgi:hypothetical protein